MNQNTINRIKGLEQGHMDDKLLVKVRHTLALIKQAAAGEAGTVDPSTGVVTLVIF